MDPIDHTDEELVALHNEGERSAFPELIKRYLTPIYNFTLRGGCDADSAEDVSQEIFVKVWKNLEHYDESAASFKTWLFRIARNAIVDYLRKRKHIALSSFDTDEGDNPVADTLEDTAPLQDEIFARVEDKKMIEEALLKLSFADREVIVLHEYEEMTFEEIGHVLHEPLNTAKSRHRRALVKLRSIILNQKPH